MRDWASELRAIADGRLMLHVRNGVTVSRSMLAMIADEIDALRAAPLAPAEVGRLVGELRDTYTEWNNPPSDGLPNGAGIMLQAATALEAQAAELAEVHQRYVDANEARIDAEAALAERAGGVNEDALRALAQAYDREDSAQRGEPDPWNLDDPGDIGDSDTWVSERLGCARVAAEAFLAALEPVEAVPVAFMDAEGNVSVADGSPLPAMLRSLPDAPIGKPLLALYAHPPAQAGAVTDEMVEALRNIDAEAPAKEPRDDWTSTDLDEAFYEGKLRGSWEMAVYAREALTAALGAQTPPEGAVTEAMVEAAVQAVRQYTRETLLIDEHRELVRAALKAAMEAGR